MCVCVSVSPIVVLVYFDQNTTGNDKEIIQPPNALRMQQGPIVAQMS